MGIKSKFKNFKATPKVIIAIIVALLIIAGAYAGVKFGLPALLGKNESGKLDIDRYAELDCTDAAADAFTEALGSRFRCTGEVIAEFHLVMKDDEFVLELDRSALDTALDNFAYDNADALLKSQLATSGVATDEASLNEYAVSIGYADWQTAVWATADSLTSGVFRDMTEGDIYYDGTYEISKEGVASYISADEVLFTGKSASDGTIIIKLPLDKTSPEFLFDYFKRGAELDFAKGSVKNSDEPGVSDEDTMEGKGGSASGNDISVNFILETAETTEETVETTEAPTETTAAPTPTPIPSPTPVPEDDEE